MPKLMAMFQTPIFVGAIRRTDGDPGAAYRLPAPGGGALFRLADRRREIDFGRLFAATPWLGLPFVLETVVQTVYVAVNGHLVINQGLSLPRLHRQPDRGRWQPGLRRAGHAHPVLVVAPVACLQAPPGWSPVGRRRRPCSDAAVRSSRSGRASGFRRPE